MSQDQHQTSRRNEAGYMRPDGLPRQRNGAGYMRPDGLPPQRSAAGWMDPERMTAALIPQELLGADSTLAGAEECVVKKGP
jgi:hypothetical protein